MQLMEVEETHGPAGRTHTYMVTGSLFFVTVQGFLNTFDFQEDVDLVVLDLSAAHVWDGSAVDAIDRAVLRFRRRGVELGALCRDASHATLNLCVAPRKVRVGAHRTSGTLRFLFRELLIHELRRNAIALSEVFQQRRARCALTLPRALGARCALSVPVCRARLVDKEQRRRRRHRCAHRAVVIDGNGRHSSPTSASADEYTVACR